MRRGDLAQRFGSAVSYDAYARVQPHAARHLTSLIERAVARPARILEVGCGTGGLTKRLAALYPEAAVLATDLAPGMLERAATQVASARVQFMPLNAEDAAALARVGGDFDLVCSSLCAQWFTDRRGTLRRLAALVRPGGICALSILCNGTFPEWRLAHEACGVTPATPTFADEEDLRADWAASGTARWSFESYTEPTQTALAFMRGLRGLGADRPRPGHRPLSAGRMRRVMTRFERQGGTATYRVGYGVLLR
ncbi:methyltransferase domain-containing protein [Ameyamaea chiangmaiensis]|nr:methyltransferase domain-containing protein [Ameyamaea chiangmaiensis]MBS4073719.1 methyltransferase domain-containing protein [Ameyamaea chiangmaiensis]